MLLNRKTVHSYEQVFEDVAREINKGLIKKITTITGQKVTQDKNTSMHQLNMINIFISDCMVV